MKVSFVYRGYENIGIQMLSAYLRRAGHETRLHFEPLLFGDMLLTSRRLIDWFSYDDAVLADLTDYGPELVCFSVVTFDFAWARRIAERVRASLPTAKIVFGGIHVTSNPSEVLAAPCVDFVVVGEGDEAIVDLANALQDGNPVDAIANVGAAAGTPNPPRPLIRNLDALPFADKELHYRVHPLFRIGYTILSGRGCPNNCSYCHNNIQRKIYHDQSYLRRRSVDSVVEELAQAKRDTNPFLIRFSDDNFCYDIEWLEEFADKHPARAATPFWCFIHPGCADARTIAALKRAGCLEVQMGVQTFEPEIRRHVIGRSETEQQIIEGIDGFRRAGIRISTDFIINLPGHTEANLVKAATVFMQHPPHRIHTFWLSYFPSLDITRFAIEHGVVSPGLVNDASQDSSPNTFFRGGTAFDRDIAKTQILFLLASLKLRAIFKWLARRGRYRRLPFVGFTLYWFLTYSTSFLTLEKKNDLYGKRMKAQYSSYGIRRVREFARALFVRVRAKRARAA